MTGKEKITSSKSKSANRTVAKDLKRKMKRISKYGRCKHNGARFRQQSSKVRQSKWRIDPDNAILQNNIYIWIKQMNVAAEELEEVQSTKYKIYI